VPTKTNTVSLIHRATAILHTTFVAQRAAMFFLKELEKTIQLHPSYFGPLIRSHIHKELLQKEEGSSTGKYTIVCILDSFDISDGQVMPGSGSAEYTVHYKAIVWRPYKGEVVRLDNGQALRR
jgi:DNA-directed RNA polymerase subunit E'/Rpb7